MPTTGEFGQTAGFGDYDNHQEVATLVGIHYTRSRETAQGQPAIDDFENSQIRLSDGTLLFSPDPFGTGGKVERATYQMVAVNAGIKYRGFALEGEYYFRWVDDFDVIGTIPVTELYDDGFSLQASAMVLQNRVQAYTTYSRINGQYGDPTEFSIGVNIFPFRRREVRWNFQALRLDHSPVGGSSLLLIVIFVGYESFVSRLDVEHDDRPSWIGEVGYSGLKIKLLSSLVAITAIDLLKAFMEIQSDEGHPPHELRWLVGIHLTLLATLVLSSLGNWLNGDTDGHR